MHEACVGNYVSGGWLWNPQLPSPGQIQTSSKPQDEGDSAEVERSGIICELTPLCVYMMRCTWVRQSDARSQPQNCLLAQRYRRCHESSSCWFGYNPRIRKLNHGICLSGLFPSRGNCHARRRAWPVAHLIFYDWIALNVAGPEYLHIPGLAPGILAGEHLRRSLMGWWWQLSQN